MKNSYKVSFYLFLLILLCSNVYAFPTSERNNEDNKSLISKIIPVAKEVESVEVSTIIELDEPQTLEEKFSYAYSYLLYLSTLNQDLDIDVKYYAKGAIDAAEGKALYTEEEIVEIIQEMQQEMLSNALKQQEEIAKMNLEEAENFLETNLLNENIIETESGLQYKVILDSKGLKPEIEDKVVIKYKIYSMDNKLLLESDGDTTFNLKSLVPGFIEGISLMNEGSKYRFFVHPKLAYGMDGTEDIPPNTLLIFDVELVEILNDPIS